MIDLTINEATLESAAHRAHERSIRIPTFKQMRDPSLIPNSIKEQLKGVGLWDLDPLNLFRITWHNEPTPTGGGFGKVNYLEVPKEITGVDARIIMLEGKWFPTGAHKVGAAFGCLVPRLVTGQFDPVTQKAVWPSTGNYCRGGAYDSNLLACESVAILPEGMSAERFHWLESVAGEIIKTPGTESNVKEIFDKCNELRASGEDLVIFNQFDEFGNYLWHYSVTGPAMVEVLNEVMGPNDRFAGVTLTTGSAGTIGSGDYLKQVYPASKIVAGEATECPTMILNGFGEHRIEGIGDKHIPWIHNMKNTDMAMAIDDESPMSLIRLFNEPAGQEYLAKQGVPSDFIEKLPLLGHLRRRQYADGDQVRQVVRADRQRRRDDARHRLDGDVRSHGSTSSTRSAATSPPPMRPAPTTGTCSGQSIDHVQELGYYDRKRIHNLKYYTWVEQQGKTYDEIQASVVRPRLLDQHPDVGRPDRRAHRPVQRQVGL